MAVAVVNGPTASQFIDSIDVNDPDYIRQLLRPPTIKEDVKLMQQRSRVSLILRSPYFRKELEKIVASQMKDGCLSANIAALKQLLDCLTPHTKLGSSTFSKGATVPVVPINDLKGTHPDNYVKGERLVRCKLASVYRLVELFGWNKGINCHVTVRVARDMDEFLINPTGLLYHEITASSLIKIDLDGTIVDPGTVDLGVDRQGWMLHSAMHAARPDVRCIIHLNTPATIAISCTKSGLLPVSQEAMILGEIAYYDPSSIVVRSAHGDAEMDVAARRAKRSSDERAALATLLSGRSQECMVVMIRNNGFLAMGQSIEEAWFSAFTAVVACEAQLRLSCINEDELVLPIKEAQQAANYVGRTPASVQLRPGESVGSSGWRRGELEFEALMRRLDAAGYRTGHVYRLGQIHVAAGTVSTLRRPLADIPDGVAVTESLSPREAAAFVRKTASLGRGFRGLKDVEIPPTTSSFATAYYGDDESRELAAAEARAKTLSLSRTHWFNTPNMYARQDIAEVGTPTPKMIAHWTEELNASKRHTGGGTAVLIDNPNQFAPQGRDPYEFKRKQKKVKDNYYNDIKNAGPTSRILEGLDADDGDLSDGMISPVVSPRGTLLRLDPTNPPSVEPGHVVVVGAASKGIINRQQRHNAGIYQSVYSPNPFDHITDEDLERYRENMDRKTKGLPSLEDEEAMARIEEARKAAEIARQAMESAASQPQRYLQGRSLDVDASRAGQSGTSGAEASHDDTEKETPKDDTVGEKKKKRRFKMPSFARKTKPKSKN